MDSQLTIDRKRERNKKERDLQGYRSTAPPHCLAASLVKGRSLDTAKLGGSRQNIGFTIGVVHECDQFTWKVVELHERVLESFIVSVGLDIGLM